MTSDHEHRQQISDTIKKNYPNGTRVHISGTHLTGVVTGHASYQMAFVGLTTFLVVYVYGKGTREYSHEQVEKA